MEPKDFLQFIIDRFNPYYTENETLNYIYSHYKDCKTEEDFHENVLKLVQELEPTMDLEKILIIKRDYEKMRNRYHQFKIFVAKFLELIESDSFQT